MTKRPIIFNGSMVRALPDGTKTHTRRLNGLEKINLEPHLYSKPKYLHDNCWHIDGGKHGYTFKCPYGKVGDQLYVRETWGVGTRPCPRDGWVEGIEYRADEPLCDGIENMPLYRVSDEIDLSKYDKLGWKPSIHMPKWASRITLEITNVRVERLNDISEDDAISEGLLIYNEDDANLYYTGISDENSWPVGWQLDPIHAFKDLWESIYGSDSWNYNPWVWVVEFKKI